MTEPTVFSKKHADALTQDKRALLEELNLPPVMVEFIRTNAKALQLSIAIIIISILAWEGYVKYTAVQRDRSADMLYTAMKADGDQRLTQLKELSTKYGKRGSGLWGTIEQGHLAFKEGKFQEAATLYEAVISSIPSGSPLLPLVQFNLAQTYENLPDQAKAKATYQILANTHGFAGEGNLGLARIAELEEKQGEAKTLYQTYVDLPETKDGPTKEWVKNKIQTLAPKKTN
jgi:predicted negative regulator of RcsB-dependent stress response